MDNKNLPVNRHIIKEKEIINDVVKDKIENTKNDFAAVFPEWGLMPPAVVVKRVRRGI